MPHILLIEDEVNFRSVMAFALIQHGYEVSQAGNGRTGLEMLKTSPIDLVITDVVMPEQDGVEVLMKLRDAPNSPPIIAISGHPASAESFLKVATLLGAKRALAKPFSMDDLLAAIREVLPA